MKYYKRQSGFMNMKTPRQMIALKRERLEALRRGEGIHHKRTPDPEHLKFALKGIEHLIDYAERVYREIESQRDIDFFHALIELAQANIELARYVPHIIKDSEFLLDRGKTRAPKFSAKLVVDEIKREMNPAGFDGLLQEWRDGINEFGEHGIECWHDGEKYCACVAPESPYYHPNKEWTWSEGTLRNNW